MGKLMFGKDETIACIQPITLKGAEGEGLCLAYKTSKYNKPVKVVRWDQSHPAIELDLGLVKPSVYALRIIAATAPKPIAQNELVKSLTDIGYKATDATKEALVEGLGNVEQVTGGSVPRTVGDRSRSAVYQMNATIAKQILKGITGT